LDAPNKSIIDAYLEEQQRLQTPVARFSEDHARNAGPALEPVYRDLIPLSKPGPHEQYAFEVDLDSCTGCKACVSACHSLNGLDENETWRDVGLLLGGTPAAPYQQTITTACHHCADPACMTGCPVLAYEKDPRTGIVHHLDDQCIGCQYCVLKCPYDVPKYNERLGIIRKCDMCHQRLSAGEAPACVQACPTQAISIVTVSVHHSEPERVDTSTFLVAAPAPDYTQPTTRYLSQRPLPENARAADANTLRPQPPHWPLVVMLTLLPAAICTQAMQLFPIAAGAPAYMHWVPIALGAIGLAAASLHLGQPLRAWRVFLGLHQSWFSREAVLFGAWVGFLVLRESMPMFNVMTVFTGALGLFSSVMIYVDTRRSFWRFSQTFPRFVGTGTVLALALVAPEYVPKALALKLAYETLALCGRGVSARLLRGPLLGATLTRYALGLAGVLVTYYITNSPRVPLSLSVHGAIVALLLAGELAERYLFFRAVDAPKMPGMPSAAGSVA